MDQRLESLFEKYGLPGAELAEANLNKRDKKLAVVIRAGSVPVQAISMLWSVTLRTLCRAVMLR